MYQVTKEINFCYGHRLRDYPKKCKHLHGHNGRVEITLEAANLDHRGMLVDFEDIKDGVQTWIMSELDHKLLLRKDDPLVPMLSDMNETFLVMDDNPTAENIARMIYEYTKSKGFPVISVKLWETPTSFAIYTER